MAVIVIYLNVKNWENSPAVVTNVDIIDIRVSLRGNCNVARDKKGTVPQDQIFELLLDNR